MAAANIPVPADDVPLPYVGHFAPGYDVREVRNRICREGGRGLNHTITPTATVGIMVNYYFWTDLFTVGGKVVHLAANCPSVIKARGTATRLTSAEYGNSFHNVRICDHCISRGA